MFNTNNSETEITGRENKNNFEDFSAATFDNCDQNKNNKMSLAEELPDKIRNTEIKVKEADRPN